MKKCYFILSAMLMVSGCTHYSLSKEECLGGKWQDIGYSDGSEGWPQDRVESHNEACRE